VFPVAADELVDVVKRVENAVVRIDTDEAFGSGVVVDDRGYVFTNFHVIEDAQQVTIKLRSGKEVKALGFVAVDVGRDLALLKTDPLKPCGIRIAKNPPSIGEKVAAFGNPEGYEFSTTEGIVSAIRTGRDMIASDEAGYRSLGYVDDARWIQTSAAISGGNSGGPLVNMNAEVVGLNTWTDLNGDNLNFAISAMDMNDLVAKIKKTTVTDFAKLPRRSQAKSLPAAPLEDFRLELPTGRVFSFGVFGSISLVELLKAANSEDERTELVTLSHANDTPYAAVNHLRGVLNGTAIVQHDNREVMMISSYVDGKRHGLLKMWDQAGQLLLLAQYARGRKHGYLMLFDDDTPTMLVDYRYDKATWVQLMHGLTPLEGFASAEEALKNSKAREQLERLDKIEADLKAREVDFRKLVATEEQERRKELARQLAPEKRARIRARANARAAADRAYIRSMYRAAYGR
jgi:hypothetical protein